MVEPDDRPLAGGNMGAVVRRGDTVIREAGWWSPAVHRLLARLTAAGVPGIPHPLGQEGPTERLSFVEGDVPAHPLPTWIWAKSALVSAARLLRHVHDATADGPWEGPWRSPVHEPVEVVCHNDFAPYNLVFREGLVIGVIDWDYASPGPRIWDVAYLAYQLVPLTTTVRTDGFSDEQRADRLSMLMTEYGVDGEAVTLLMVVQQRLVELANLTDILAKTLGKPELHEHARTYRIDAAALGESLGETPVRS